MTTAKRRRAAARTLLRALPRWLDDRSRRRRLPAGPWDRRALASLLLALVVMLGSFAFALSRSGPRRSGTDGVWVQANVVVAAGETACQARELLPAQTSVLQIPGVASRRPTVFVRDGGHVLARVRARTDPSRELIEAQIARTVRDRPGVEVCLRFPSRAVLFVGPSPPDVENLAIDGSAVDHSMAISYLMPGRQSWWDYAPTMAARVGRGAASGGATPWVIAALLAASLALTGRVVVRMLVLDRPMPRAALAIVAIGALNAATWSFISPPFQVPDEVAHVAYAQSIGETGKPPSQPRAVVLSTEQAIAMADSGFGSVFGRTLHAAAWSPFEQHRLTADLGARPSRNAEVYAGEGEPEPPLYYALQALPYRLAHGGTLLDRIMLMRLLSASLAGVTALLAFLFVRECLPARPWAGAVGGLSIAFTPMLGFISGGVNPDALLFALSAGLFLCIARAWRRGVTRPLALVVGALIGAGLLTKVNIYGLVPGTMLGLALAARRSVGAWDRRLVWLLASCAGLAVVLFAAGTGFQVLAWDRPFAVGRPTSPESHVSLLSHLGYIWQVFLPRLPFQEPTTLTRPGYQQLFETFVGAYGWCVVWLPRWAYRLAIGCAVVIGLLAARMLHAEPRELRWRRGEIVGYGAMAGVMMLMIGIFADLRRGILHIVQGRYLLPLLPLLGLHLTLAARGAGERWGRAVGIWIVCGAVAWSVIGELATIAFFYS